MKFLISLFALILSLSLNAQESTAHQKVAPEEIQKLLEISKISNQNVLKATLKQFPAESFYFYAAEGIVLATMLLSEMEKNPNAVEEFLNRPFDPVTHISFFAFMLTNRATASILFRLIDQKIEILPSGKVKVLKKAIISPHSRMGQLFFPLNNIIGMGLGMYASHFVSEILYDPNIKKCAGEILFGKTDSGCKDAYKDWVVNGKIRRQVPALTNLLMASFGAQVSFQMGKVILQAIKLPIHAGKFAGPLGKISHFSLFLLNDRLIHKQLNIPFQNILYEGNILGISRTNFGIISGLKREITQLIEERNYKKLNEKIEEFNFEVQKYLQSVNSDAQIVFYNWSENITNLQMSFIGFSKYYQNIINNILKIKNGIKGFNPLTVKNPLHRVFWNEKSESFISAWSKETSQESKDFKFTIIKRKVDQLCLNPIHFNEQSNKFIPLCKTQRSLKKEHLLSIARDISISSIKFPYSYYIKKISNQKRSLNFIRNAFISQQEDQIEVALSEVNKIVKQIKFAKRNGTLNAFKETYWENLQKGIVGFSNLSLSDMVDNTRFDLASYFLTEDEVIQLVEKESINKIRAFKPAIPLKPGVSYLLALNYDESILSDLDRIKLKFDKEHFRIKTPNFSQTMLAYMLCGKERPKLKIKSGFSYKVHPHKIIKGPFPCNKKYNSKKKEINGEMVSTLINQIDLNKLTNNKNIWDSLYLDMRESLNDLKDDFEKGYFKKTLPFIYHKKRLTQYLTGVKHLPEIIKSLSDFYLNSIEKLADLELETKISHSSLDLENKNEFGNFKEFKSQFGTSFFKFSEKLMKVATKKTQGAIMELIRSNPQEFFQQFEKIKIDLGFEVSLVEMDTDDLKKLLREEYKDVLETEVFLSEKTRSDLYKRFDTIISVQEDKILLLDLKQVLKNYMDSNIFAAKNNFYVNIPQDNTDEANQPSMLDGLADGLENLVIFMEEQANGLQKMREELNKEAKL